MKTCYSVGPKRRVMSARPPLDRGQPTLVTSSYTRFTFELEYAILKILFSMNEYR